MKTFKSLFEETSTPVSFPISTAHHSTYVKHLDREDALNIHQISPTDVDIKDIRATQKTVNLARVHKFMRDGNNGEHPEGVRHNGKVHILDGHHRAEAAVKAGHKQVRMHVFDMDALHVKENLEEAKKEEIESWHGSPHKFSAFSRKNTAHSGEGGAAYGSGIYVSSHRAVGEFYRDAKKGGTLYHTSLNIDPKRMMHWHKPVSEQPPHVQKVLNSVTDFDRSENSDPQARHIFHHLRRESGSKDRVGASEYASKHFADRGVHGIEYHGDIDAKAKERPTNRVIFDPKRITIKNRFDQKGLVIKDGEK